MKNKEKKIFEIILILIIIVIGIIIIVGTTNKNETKKEENTLCKTIELSNKNKENFVIFFKEKNQEVEPIKELKATYKDLKIYEIDYKELEKECIKNIITMYYEDIKQNEGNVPYVIFKEGKFNSFHNMTDGYTYLEDNLENDKIIVRKDYEENITLKELKIRQNKDKYIIIVVAHEKDKKAQQTLADKYFSNIEHDIIYYRSKKGEEIYNYLNKNYKMTREFPALLYFSKGKEKYYSSVYDDEFYKETLEKINNQDK